MKATTVIVSILSVALTATAAPAMDAVLEERTGGGGGTTTTCSAKGYKQVCCNSGLLGCLVQILGAHCSQQAYCCKTDASTVSSLLIVLRSPRSGFVKLTATFRAASSTSTLRTALSSSKRQGVRTPLGSGQHR